MSYSLLFNARIARVRFGITVRILFHIRMVEIFLVDAGAAFWLGVRIVDESRIAGPGALHAATLLGAPDLVQSFLLGPFAVAARKAARKLLVLLVRHLLAPLASLHLEHVLGFGAVLVVELAIE